MGAECLLCKEGGIDPRKLCRRPDTPLVQGRKEYLDDREGWKLIEEGVDRCPVVILFRGTEGTIEIGGAIRPKLPVQEVQTIRYYKFPP